MHALKQAVEWVWVAKKPPQHSQQQHTKRYSNSSNAGGKHANNASSTSSSKPTSAPQDYGTKRDAEMRQRVEAERDRLLKRAAHGTDILEEMNQPRDAESPTQLQEIANMLASIMEAQTRIEREQQEQRRLLNAVLRPRA
jgi:hypothetical protein